VKALLGSPTSRASVSHWVRCSSDLVFSQQHPQANWVHCNASSLMFRRQVVETLGYWDAVTVGADAEYYYRILSIYGRQAIKEVLPGVPLAFGRHHPDSLTQRSETHARGLYYGLRREYQESFDAWHGQIKRARFSPCPPSPCRGRFPRQKRCCARRRPKRSGDWWWLISRPRHHRPPGWRIACDTCRASAAHWPYFTFRM
jgi:hypothetical protein